MPRKHISTICNGPFHVTLRNINQEWHQLSMDEVWVIFERWLYLTKHAFHLQIHNFVLMNNHYHMMLSTPEKNLSDAMMYFHREVSRDLNRFGNRINRNFSGPFFKSQLLHTHNFLNCYKYVYQNPLRAGLVSRAEDYKYSTLSGILGLQKLIVPVEYDYLLFDGKVEETLDWINSEILEENLESFRGALRKPQFKLRRDPVTRKPNILESHLI